MIKINISKMKNKRRILVILVFLTVTINLLYTNSWQIQTARVYYIVNNFVEYYVRPIDKYQPDLSLTSSTNSLCRIPKLQFDHPQALKYLAEDASILETIFNACHMNNSKLTSLAQTSVNSQEVYKIYLNMSLIIKNFQLTKSAKCTLQTLDKKMNVTESLNELDLGSINYFPASHTLQVTQPGYYYISCWSNSKLRNSLVFDTVLTVLPYNMSKLMQKRFAFRGIERDALKNLVEPGDPLVVDKEFERCHEHPVNKKKMSVLVIGLDSISTSQFRRVFPRTYKHLTGDSTIFENLNSVGSNTYPNMIAMLTGLVETALPEYSLPDGEIDFFRQRDKRFHDHLPFIWKAYEDLGYVSMYQEDEPRISIFNYVKDGFRHWAAGLYNRAFSLQYYQKRSGPDKCHFGQPTFDAWFNQIEMFVERMNQVPNNETPFFSFNFLTEYTHDFMAVSDEFDKRLESTLSGLKTRGLLNNTLIILTGDHGNRIRRFSYATELGKLERYRPFLSITLPKSLRNTQLGKNLQTNHNRLISFFDLYQTLRHFLFINKCNRLGDKQFSSNLHTIRSNRGISLFENVPSNRSCHSALIPSRFCNCYTAQAISDQRFNEETGGSTRDHIAKLVRDNINQLTSKQRHLCAEFRVNRTEWIKKVHLASSVVYTSMVVLEPGEAWFEASLALDQKTKNLKIQGSITRMSSYGEQSSCIKSASLKDYCFCGKNLII